MRTYEYLLHYVGQGLYSRKEFIDEARRLGVNRAFPITMFKRLKWGDQILLATHNSDNNVATVFGYYDIQGINLAGDEEAKTRFFDNIRVLKIVSDDTPKPVARKCGSYYVGAVYIVEDTLEEIADKVKQATEQGGKLKVFVYGAFHALKTPREIPSMNFTRSGIFIKTFKRIRNNPRGDGAVASLQEYKQKLRKLKQEKINHILDEFGEHWRFPGNG